MPSRRRRDSIIEIRPNRTRGFGDAMNVKFLTFALFALVHARESFAQQISGERTNLQSIFDLIFSPLGHGHSQTTNEGDGLHHASRFECPLCDSSVYSYCSEKLLHDACCCLNPYEHRLPQQCRYADCSFLHANSCREHKLITACCCSRLLKGN